MKKSCGVILFILISLSVLALDFNWKLESQLFVTEDKKVFNSSCFQLSYKEAIGNLGRGKLVFKGLYESIYQKTIWELTEATIKLTRNNIDFDTGYGYIAWGTADGINPTDVINPYALTTSLTSLDKEPVFRSALTVYNKSLVLSGIIVHQFLPVNLERIKNLMPGLVPNNIPIPENSLKNQEFALALETWFLGYDWKLSFFNGFDDWPELAYTFLINPLTGKPVEGSESIIGRYRKQKQLGLATAGTLGQTGCWAEIAYILPEEKAFTSDNPLQYFVILSPTKPYLKTIAGFDYTFSGKLYMSLQYLYQQNGGFLIPYRDPQKEGKALHGFLTRLSYSINTELNIDTTIISDLTNKASIYVPEIVYKLSNTTIKLSYTYPTGEKGELTSTPKQVSLSILETF